MDDDVTVADPSDRHSWPRMIHPVVKQTTRTRLMAAIAANPPWWECWYCAAPLVPLGSPAALAVVTCDASGIIRPIGRYAFPQVDHMIPRSQGGPDEIWNLALSCWPCNREKGVRSVEDFIEAKYPWMFV